MRDSISHNTEHLLDDLLLALVSRWGHDTVRARLDKIEVAQTGQSVSHQSNAKRHRRLSALEYVEKNIKFPGIRRDLLLELASRFDQKKFLPTVGDVRNFLGPTTLNWKSIKIRDAVIPTIIAALQSLSDDKLQMMVHGSSYGGPSTLGPLADAIKERGAGMRSRSAAEEDGGG